MQDWSCDQIETFDTLAEIYTIYGYIVKGIQMIIFSYVILFLLLQRFRGRNQIKDISMLIAVLSLLNSVFCIVRINTLFPFYVNNELLGSIFALENIGYFGATWLFGIKYYETAIDFEQMILGDPAYFQTYDSIVKTMTRKRRFNLLHWSMFVFMCVLCIFTGVSMFNDATVQGMVDLASYSLLSIVVAGIAIAMAAAFLKFYRIVARMQDKPDFNCCYIVTQIAGMSVFVIAWTLAGISLCIHKGTLSDFPLQRNLMICAIVGFTSNLLVFQIIAIVIYKSSIVAGKDRSSEVGGESNNIILHEIKGQYDLER